MEGLPELELPEDAKAPRQGRRGTPVRAEADTARRARSACDAARLTSPPRRRARAAASSCGGTARPPGTWSAASRAHGHRADEAGSRQAAARGPAARLPAPDAIVASDLSRARGHRGRAGRAHRPRRCHDEGLRETYAGVWQGLTHERDHRARRRAVRRVEARRAACRRRRRAGDRGRRPGRARGAAARREAPARRARSSWSATAAPSATTIGRLLGLDAPLGGPRRPLQLLLVRPRRGRARLAAAGAQRRHAARAGDE